MGFKSEETDTLAKKAAKLNLSDTEEYRESGIDPDIVDQIFEELDDYSSKMIEQWKEDAVWADNEDTKAYLRLKRSVKRAATLDRLVPDRKCPECKGIEIRDSHWRVDKWHSSAICWTCFKTTHTYQTVNSKFYPGYDEWEIIQLIHRIFHQPIVRYHINERNFQHIRSMLGIPRRIMAEELGITQMTVSLIEEGKIKTMLRDNVVKCMKLYRKYFIKRLKDIGYEDVDKYVKNDEWSNPTISEV